MASVQVGRFAKPVEPVHADHPPAEAERHMRDSGQALVPVVDGDEIVGVVTPENFAGQAPGGLRGVMSTEIIYCFADESPAEARAAMKRGGHSRLLVVDGEHGLLGVVEEADLPRTGEPDESVRAAHSAHSPGLATAHGAAPAPAYSLHVTIRRRNRNGA